MDVWCNLIQRLLRLKRESSSSPNHIYYICRHRVVRPENMLYDCDLSSVVELPFAVESDLILRGS